MIATETPFGLINWKKKLSKNLTGLLSKFPEFDYENEILYAK